MALQQNRWSPLDLYYPGLLPSPPCNCGLSHPGYWHFDRSSILGHILEGRGRQMNETFSQGIVNIVRASTRPALTFFGLVSWVMLFANGYEIPDGFTVLVAGMVIWWFGDRTYFKKKSVENKKQEE